MGGVDDNDQLRGYYHVRLKCRKLYKYIFWFLFDVAIVNSFIVSTSLTLAAPIFQYEVRIIGIDVTTAFNTRIRDTKLRGTAMTASYFCVTMADDDYLLQYHRRHVPSTTNLVSTHFSLLFALSSPFPHITFAAIILLSLFNSHTCTFAAESILSWGIILVPFAHKPETVYMCAWYSCDKLVQPQKHTAYIYIYKHNTSGIRLWAHYLIPGLYDLYTTGSYTIVTHDLSLTLAYSSSSRSPSSRGFFAQISTLLNAFHYGIDLNCTDESLASYDIFQSRGSIISLHLQFSLFHIIHLQLKCRIIHACANFAYNGLTSHHCL